jgi:hypothetical protein
MSQLPDPGQSQNRPSSPQQAPDPATNYERAKPEKEAGMGSLNSPVGRATPTRRDDHADRPDDHPKGDEWDKSASNIHTGTRQINAHDDPGGTGGGGQPLNQVDLAGRPMPAEQPDHSMKDEEPLGWDQVPTDIHDPQQQRHPRTGGKGGTPDAGDRSTRG